ncbi:Uncharacterised protein [uncultured archaeon]|nr:Uncharacterised protein [uncultured archaeon]
MDELVLQYGNPDMFILVHYFGFPGKLTEALHFCKQFGAELLEDGAHVLMPFNNTGKKSWATVFSPYKLLPVPKMGILVTSGVIENDKEAGEKKKWIDMDSCIWIGKRLLQSFLTKYEIPWRSEKVPPFELDIEEEYKDSPGISIMPLRLLRVLEPEFEHFKKIRRKNYKIMEEAISICPHSAHPLFPSLPENVCPYLFPFRLDDKIIGDVYYNLNRIGIPAQTWPDLPPEVKGNPSRYMTAIKLRKTLLTLPVHQNLSACQVDRMAQYLRSSILEALNS